MSLGDITFLQHHSRAETRFTIQLMPKQKRMESIAPRIRETILKIPRGNVSSYGAVARAAGLPNGARLVVRVLAQSHGLPWYRVVAAGGRIATPGEHGMDQRFRLEMEGVKFSGRKVRMAEFEFKFSRTPSRKIRKKATRKASRKTVPDKTASREIARKTSSHKTSSHKTASRKSAQK